MNRSCRHALLAPLIAVLAMLLGLTESASAAFNAAAQNPHYGNFLLRESEASASEWLQLADPTKENGEWIYDSTLGVPVYVRQNPWTKFDPLGLWETDSYWGDVGQVYVGMGRAIKGTAVGLYTMARHPVQTAKGIGSAVASPIQTGKAIVADYESKLQTNAGVGEIVGEVLIGVATGGSVKALDKASDVADIAKITNKIDDVADVGGASARKIVDGTDNKQHFGGGAHSEMKGPKGDGLESHHMPDRNADPSVSPENGPAIRMEPNDHQATSSWGPSREAATYRAETAQMIQDGKYRNAMAREARDVRRAAHEVSGDRRKYNSSMREMLDYAKSSGQTPDKK